jgi:phosphopantetheinyl transferase
MPENIKSKYIQHPLLPEDIILAVYSFSSKETVKASRSSNRKYQKLMGRQLISKVIADSFGSGQCNIFSEENGKPHATLDNKPLHITIAHCSGMVCGAVSESYILGVDIEDSSRKCYPGLRKRIMNPEEEELVREISTLRLWTIKEAALKWSGSGLRMSMNSIILRNRLDSGFGIEFPGGNRINTFSFQHTGYWIALAYDTDG